MSVSAASTTSIAFIDDHPTVLMGLASMFSEQPGFEVVASGANADEAIMVARANRPEVLFIDLSMPGDVFAAIKEITSQLDSKIVVLTAFSSLETALRAIEAGASGFVPKGSSFDEMLSAVESVLRGDLYLTSQYLGQVVNALSGKRDQDELEKSVRLSVREKQILRGLLHANTNKQIAMTLGLSEQTVKNYMTKLMAKLKVKNRLEMVIAAKNYSNLN